MYWNSLRDWVQNLAGDSISEANTTNLYYIKSWILSLFNYLEADLRIKSFIKLYTLGFLLFFIFSKYIRKPKIYLLFFPITLSTIFLYLFININILHLVGNINTQKNVQKSFIDKNLNFGLNNEINLIVFIGESTSSLHASKYLEILKKSTDLNTKGKIDFLKNVYSTHVHSSPSLLRLLSFPESDDFENIIKPIVNRSSISLFNIVNKKIKKSYISSTNINGYNNLHYPIFFKDFENQKFLKDSVYKYEKKFFLNEYREIIKRNKTNNLIIFHSSVGHSPYENYIPKAYNKKNNVIINDNDIKLLGKKSNTYNDVIAYENALKYNFENLHNLILEIEPNIPSVFIYFSDHGESVYTGNGHDSSRLVHEMLRVPFFMFYNNKFIHLYKKKIIDKLDIFGDEIKTTDIFSKIIFSLYGLDAYKYNFITNENNKYEKIILRRKKKDQIEVIDLNFNKVNLPKNYKIINEKDTNIHILSTNISDKKICYHSANTIARVKRGGLVTSCLEFDLNIEQDDLYVYHPPNKNLDFTLDQLLIEAKEIKSFWIDGKNINSQNCQLLLEKLRVIKNDKVDFFIEFPTHTKPNDYKLRYCLNGFTDIGIDTSYYISNQNIDLCLKNLSEINNVCMNLMNTINEIDAAKMFNNISFDYKFSKILDFYNYKPKNLRFNTWHINFDEVKKLNFDLYNLVIPYSSNFNRNIY